MVGIELGESFAFWRAGVFARHRMQKADEDAALQNTKANMTVKSGASSTFPPELAGRLQREGAYVPSPRERRSISDFNGTPSVQSHRSNQRGLAHVLRWANKASADFWLSFFFGMPTASRGLPLGPSRFSSSLSGDFPSISMAARWPTPPGFSVNPQRKPSAKSWPARRSIISTTLANVGLSLGQTPRQMLDRIISVENPELYINTQIESPSAGKGAIILTAHMGSFEVGRRRRSARKAQCTFCFGAIRSTCSRRFEPNCGRRSASGKCRWMKGGQSGCAAQRAGQ